MTCVAFSIKFAKTNQKFAENSEFCEQNSLLFKIIHFSPYYQAFDFEGGPFTDGARRDEAEFEIRLTVIDVNKISIFKDSGQRNDAKMALTALH